MHHVCQFSGVFLIHNHQLVIQDTHDAVMCTIDLGDVGVLQAGLDNAVCGAVNDGGRAAGLTDNQGTYQSFFRHKE